MADTYRPERRDRGRDRVSMSPRPASPPPATAARDRSSSPLPRRRAPPPAFAASRRRTPPPEPTAEQKQAAAQAEYNRLLNARSGGVYMPPARLRALQAQVQDKSSKEYQRMAWEALKKSINGLVNKATAANMRQIINELFAENLVRGRGLLTQSLIKAQYASTPFTAVYACIAACINSKLPAVGELLLRRLLLRFRKGFRRNDKAVCRSATTFLAHLVNTQVADEMIAAQMLLLLLHNPTDDSVEIAVNLTREVGNYLETMNPTVLVVVFDRFHYILNEADIDKRTQYAIEVLFQNRKDQFKDHPAVRDDLDLIEEEDQIKHMLELNGKFDDEATLNVFRYDEHWEENEKEYAKLRREILNESDSEDGDGDSSGVASGSDDDEDDDGDSSSDEGSERAAQTALDIKDRTNADLVALRRTIYLTIQSSMNADEAVHKLLAVDLPEGREMELPSMVIECCSQEKTYTKFFGLIAERLAKLNRRWATLFEEAFAKYYETIHRYETNRLRNIACLFGHLLASNAIGWHVLSAIHLNEEETTSASRIFIKILFQETAEAMGMAKLRARLCNDVELRPSLEGLFPVDDARHLRFAINYFTSIGMGVLTEDMRERLQNLPKPAPPAAVAAAAADDDDDNRSDSRSVSSYSSSYTGSSYSRTPSRSRSRSRSPYQRRKYDSRSPSRSRSRSTRSYTASRSPSRDRLPIRNNRAGKRGRSFSRSVSPAAPRRGDRGAATTSAAGVPPPPPPKAARRGRSSSYSSRSYSRSPSPPPAASAARKRTASPVRRGRSISPGRRRPSRRGRAASYSPSPSRSPLPRRRRSPSLPESRSPSRSRSRSLTPVRARSPRDRSPRPPVPAAAAGTRRRRRGDSVSSTGSNAPRKKNRRSE
ncbi:cell cycle control protein [Niveomyces insectorum RCEF 264]|uniref:Pre-mRNA-splicing factor CWC22 n=1 Tax=Niveomyces insectorum RCEF 264 TaxID=1081102 RepID=A0A167RFQ7_9HYPO|nr:cell cycle control protein [Niveomyces insectorum RCEF 264]